MKTILIEKKKRLLKEMIKRNYNGNMAYCIITRKIMALFYLINLKKEINIKQKKFQNNLLKC
jgi:hypothetical protein